jgi:hypothetical protein
MLRRILAGLTQGRRKGVQESAGQANAANRSGDQTTPEFRSH